MNALLAAATRTRAVLRDGPLLNPLLYVALGWAVARGLHDDRILALLVVAPVTLALAALAWRQPIRALIGVVVILPFQQLAQAWLYRRGVPTDIVTAAGYWKEIVVAVVVVRAWQERSNRAGHQPADNVERWAIAVVLLVAMYLLLPIGPGLRVRYVAGRSDAALLLILLAARWLPRQPGDVDRAERAIIYSGAVLALFGIWNYVEPEAWTRWVESTGLVDYRRTVLLAPTFDPVLRTAFGDTDVIRVGSIFLAPVSLAYTLLVSVAMAASRLVRGVAGRLDRVAGIVCLGCVVLTFTRSAIALLPVVGMVAAAGSRRLTRGFGVVVVTAVLLAVVSSLVGAGDQIRSGFDSDDPRTSSHVAALGDSVGRVVSNPLGTGLGTASATAIRFDVEGRLENSENFYLLFGTEVGLLGMVLFVGATASIARALWRRIRTEGGGPAVGAAAGLAAIALGALVLDTFAEIFATWGLFLVAGLALPRPPTDQPYYVPPPVTAARSTRPAMRGW